MQKTVAQFTSSCGKAHIYVEIDMPIGIFHDFLMEMKGLMVDRMVSAHKEQLALTEEQKKQDSDPEVI